MAAAIDTANVASNSSATGALTISVNCTCAVTDNHLLVSVAIDQSAAAGPTGVTYNGVAMTAVPSGQQNNTQQCVSWYYMNSPPTGSSLAIVATYAANYNTAAIVGMPMSGCNLALPPSAGTGTQGVPSATIACSTPTATANDIGIAATMDRGTSQTPGGAPQTNVIAPLNGINGSTSYAASYIAGPSAGNFSWTITSGNWSAIGVTVFGTASGGGSGTTQSMPANSSFNPQGNTFLVTTNGTPSTASAQVVSFNPTISSQPAAQASGLSNCPPAVCVANLGTAVVYVSFTSALRTAIVPAANPQLELPVFPGVERVFTLPQTPNVGSATPYALQINTISSAASQPLLITFGEQHLT